MHVQKEKDNKGGNLAMIFVCLKVNKPFHVH